jgi:alanine dehydrogenase
MTLILSRSDLDPLVDLRATVDAVEQAMADVARGVAVQPAPALMRLPGSESGFLPMAASSSPAGLASVKLLADVPANAAAGRATQRSSLLLVSAETGETLALLDGAVPTRIRTAAASAVASRHLARPESTTLGLVGAGALAIAHVAAMVEVLPIDAVTFWTRSAETARTFQAAVERHGLLVKPLNSPRAVVESADVVCTLTPSVTPVVSGDWFRPGLHVNAVGARPRPDHREVDSAAMTRSRVFVDHLGTVRAKAGDIVIPVADGDLRFEDIQGELGEVIAGHRPGRRGPDDITLYKSVGIGLQDLAIGRLLLDAAGAAGVGVDVDLGA